MNVLINNGKLGRMGKTTIAFTLYTQSEITSFKYVTNDLDNASIDLRKHVKDDDLIFVPHGADIDINPNEDHIFDFGGEPDQRLLSVAGYVDLIIVPLAFQSVSELELSIKNINALAEENNNILIVINNTEREDIESLKAVLVESFPDFGLLVLNRSRYMRRLANDGLTVFEVAEQNKADESRLNKVLIPQFKALFDYIGECKN